MIVDVHCHIDLYPDIDDVINRAKQANVAAVVAASMDPNSMEAILKLSRRFPDFVHPCLGLHPDSSKRITEKDLERALDLIRRSSEDLVAIGEIGLDHYFVKSSEFYPWQEKIFREMLRIANKLNLPVVLHTKGAERLVFKLLEEYEMKKVLIHWYTGPPDLISLGEQRGYYFSITPAVLYSKKVQYLVEKVSLNSLLTESDGPVTYKKVRGEPKDCLPVVKKIADIKRHGRERVEQKLFENAVSFFNLNLTF